MKELKMDKQDIFWGGFLLGMLFIGLIVVLDGCANKPDIMKQRKDCVKIKTNTGVTGYLCLDVGGDIKK
mgnify:CR=1 FL=1